MQETLHNHTTIISIGGRLGSNPDKRWHLQTRNLYMDSHNYSSDGQTNKAMEEKHQLQDQVQAQQVLGHLHPPLQVWDLDIPCWDRKKDTGIWE